MYHIVINFKSSKLASVTKRGRRSSSVPLNLLNVELSSKLIHILPHATQLCPALLSDGRHVSVVRGAPLGLLNGEVGRHVPGDPALFGLRLNVLQGMFFYRRGVGVGLSHAPERNEGLGWLAAVLACYSKAAKAVEIPKFLFKRGKKSFCKATLKVRVRDTAKIGWYLAASLLDESDCPIWFKMVQQVVRRDWRADGIHACLFVLLLFDWNSTLNLYIWEPSMSSGRSICTRTARLRAETCDSCVHWRGRLYGRGLSNLYR